MLSTAKRKPLIIAIDYSCIKYMLYFRGCKIWDPRIHGFRPEVLQYWREELQSSFTNISKAVNPSNVEYTIVGLIDKPWPEGYWRSVVYDAQQQARISQGLEPLFFKIKKQETPDISYKGNRSAKSSYTDFMKLVNQLMYELEWPILKHPGLEADDMWGILARRCATEGFELRGVTLDHDWALCTDLGSTIQWVNLHHKYYLEALNADGALALMQKTYKKVLALDQVPLAKSIKGERSDNLAPGFDPRLADLVNMSAPNWQNFGDILQGTKPWDFASAHAQVDMLLHSLNL